MCPDAHRRAQEFEKGVDDFFNDEMYSMISTVTHWS